MRFLDALEHQSADANRRFLGVDLLHVEQSFGVMVAKFLAQFVTALGNRTDSAPFAVADFEDFVDEVLRDAVALALNDAGILIFHFRAARFELANGHQSAFQQIRSARSR